ncbi:MAG: acireductone synthase [Pirellulaceae bacterium]
MIHFRGRGILLDIEGTTSSVSFVYDVMFPLVRRELDRYLDAHWGESALAAACRQIALDANQEARSGDREWIRGEVVRLMDGDVKATGLKQLQGLIWEEGFASGELKAHVYDDVPPRLRDWHSRGISLRIYSSGSIQAQKLFFGHTIAGNLLPLLSGHYDTTTGRKKEAASYQKIAADFGLPPSDILFLSDIPAELDAARTAGMQTSLVQRPGNAVVPAGHGHAEISSFAQIEFPTAARA